MGPTYCMMFCICICMIELNCEERFENKLEVNSNRKHVTHNVTLNSTGCNFLIWDRNSAFCPPLERLQNSLWFCYSTSPQISFGSGVKVQICPDSSICPELTPFSAVIDHNSWTVGRIRVDLWFLERSHNYLSLLHWTFLLILHCIQSAEFCEIVVSPNQNLYSRFFHLYTVFQGSCRNCTSGIIMHVSMGWILLKLKVLETFLIL
jgi:hypothetical protein